MSDRLILGLDMGQTSTRSLLAQADGQILGRGAGGPADHFQAAGGAERNRAAIQSAIRSAYAEAGLAPGALDAVALGVTGLHRSSPEIPLVEDMVHELLQPRAVRVYPDYVTNLLGASRGGWGVVVVAGGGSIAYGISADGQTEAIAGGWGYLLGDEGSAFDVGRRAVTAAVSAADGRGEVTVLEGLVRQEFALGEMRDIMRAVYAADFSRDRLSRLAPSVVQAAENGDAVAGSIIRQAAHDLGRVALAVIPQIAGPDVPVPIYTTGGVFSAGAIVLVPFEREVRAGWPSAEVRSPAFPPSVGALVGARLALGEIEDGWFERVQSSLG
jgi:glucosamine kinase